jgi:hypothetical protein
LPSLSAEHVALIARTVRGIPEAVIIHRGGGRTVRAVKAHMNYISRGGQLDILTDDGQILRGRGAANALIDDWYLNETGKQYRPPTVMADKAGDWFAMLC